MIVRLRVPDIVGMTQGPPCHAKFGEASQKHPGTPPAIHELSIPHMPPSLGPSHEVSTAQSSSNIPRNDSEWTVVTRKKNYSHGTHSDGKRQESQASQRQQIGSLSESQSTGRNPYSRLGRWQEQKGPTQSTPSKTEREGENWKHGQESIQRSVEDILNRERQMRKKWEAEYHAKATLTKIIEHRIGEDCWKGITKAVCLGLGSLSNEFDALKRRSLQQLTIWCWVLDLVQHKAGHHLKLFAQDPIFNETDKAILTSKGITVLEDPEAYDLIDESTFVYAPFLGWAQWSDTMLSGGCLVLWSTYISPRDVVGTIGTDCDNKSSKEQSKANQAKALEYLCKKCDCVAFHDGFSDAAAEAFQGTAIYWSEGELEIDANPE